MQLPNLVHLLAADLKNRHGVRVHKLSLHAGLDCPNRDGTLTRGGCTFCNNASFSPNAREEPDIERQIADGQTLLGARGVKKYMAYFQAYTNTHADVETLNRLWRRAVSQADIVGLSVGTRPDCVPDRVLDLLARYQDEGFDVWLELGLQSAWDSTLKRINRGHDVACWREAMRRAHRRRLRVCTHLIIGLPGEQPEHSLHTLDVALEEGSAGLKLHPLHVVKGSALANEWRRGDVDPLRFDTYADIAAEMIQRTPAAVVFHRITATAQNTLLLAPDWCAHKWPIMNAIAQRLVSGGKQGTRVGEPLPELAPPAAQRFGGNVFSLFRERKHA